MISAKRTLRKGLLFLFCAAAGSEFTKVGVSYILENPKKVETVDGCAVPLRDSDRVLVFALEDRAYHILPDRRVLSVTVLGENNFEKISTENFFVSEDVDNVRQTCSSYMSGYMSGRIKIFEI